MERGGVVLGLRARKRGPFDGKIRSLDDGVWLRLSFPYMRSINISFGPSLLSVGAEGPARRLSVTVGNSLKEVKKRGVKESIYFLLLR